MRDSTAESDFAEVVKRDERDRDRRRRKREGDRHKKGRARRSSVQGEADYGDEMAWARPGGKAVHQPASREVNVRRQASRELRHQRNRQLSSPRKSRSPIDELVGGKHVRDASNSDSRRYSASFVGNTKCKQTKTKRSSKTTAIFSSNNDIDSIVLQYGDMCDMHMAALLELKNSITSIEQDVNVSSEKDKEFQQVRGWYSSLIEKHTNLQKEHQKLQEEHLALQEKYMSLKHASSLNDSFFKIDFAAKDKKKRDKREKLSLGDVVWQRAGKITQKLHHPQHLQLE